MLKPRGERLDLIAEKREVRDEIPAREQSGQRKV